MRRVVFACGLAAAAVASTATDASAPATASDAPVPPLGMRNQPPLEIEGYADRLERSTGDEASAATLLGLFRLMFHARQPGDAAGTEGPARAPPPCCALGGRGDFQARLITGSERSAPGVGRIGVDTANAVMGVSIGGTGWADAPAGFIVHGPFAVPNSGEPRGQPQAPVDVSNSTDVPAAAGMARLILWDARGCSAGPLNLTAAMGAGTSSPYAMCFPGPLFQTWLRQASTGADGRKIHEYHSSLYADVLGVDTGGAQGLPACAPQYYRAAPDLAFPWAGAVFVNASRHAPRAHALGDPAGPDDPAVGARKEAAYAWAPAHEREDVASLLGPGSADGLRADARRRAAACGYVPDLLDRMLRVDEGEESDGQAAHGEGDGSDDSEDSEMEMADVVHASPGPGPAVTVALGHSHSHSDGAEKAKGGDEDEDEEETITVDSEETLAELLPRLQALLSGQPEGESLRAGLERMGLKGAEGDGFLASLRDAQAGLAELNDAVAVLGGSLDGIDLHEMAGGGPGQVAGGHAPTRSEL